ncbi:MAG: hypothetical protein ACI310_00225 [Bacilli bacterium]
MNNKFVLTNNGVKKDAEIVVKFTLENRDYLIYCVDENESNKQVFVSRLTLNTEGKYFIDDITLAEKNKLSNVVYNIVILTPNEAKKGIEAKSLIDKLTNEFKLQLSGDKPLLNEQNYYSNCSIAITSKLLVEEAINFFKANLTSKSEEQKLNNEVPTWSVPIVDSTVENNADPINIIGNNMSEPIAPITQDQVTPNLVINDTPINNNVTIPVTDNQQINEQVSVVEDTMNSNIPNPQAEKLAVISDPSLGNAAGLNLQPNVARKNNAGNANTKYIIIGTISLLLAVAVVVVAYFLIKNMK